MRAMIMVDDENDAVKLGVLYEGTPGNPGFSAGSHAHQHAVLIIKILDQIALKREATSDVSPVSDEEINKAFNRVGEIEEMQKLGLEVVGDERPPTIFVPTLTR